MEKILTVSELTAHIKVLLETSFDTLWVTGEISNLRRPGSGHLYFTLKDADSQIRAVIFRQSAQRIGFDLEEGMSVVCRGRLSVYQPRGEYQIIVDAAEPRGVGALQIAFEQLKKRLGEEGLFDQARKRVIPFLPRRIGIVTSPSGAAVRDILNITGRRFPSVDILIAPVRVQGLEAPPEICDAIERLNGMPRIDVIIVTRGGGSLEDLFPFNDERVARAIAASNIPVISAVGHEIDFTIADFVADLRAPTPSAAAELVVPNRADLEERAQRLAARLLSSRRIMTTRIREKIDVLRERLKDPRRGIEDFRIEVDEKAIRLSDVLRRSFGRRRERLMNARGLLARTTPSVRIRRDAALVDALRKDIVMNARNGMERLRTRLRKDSAMLDSLSPLAVLRRGYGIVKTIPDGRIVKDAASLALGDALSVSVSTGTFDAEVIAISEE